ncbi:hypothetical protein Acr_23g0011230 [Actinidia rufa]|uniref:Uncharacterized protein n=1 Tax=Actinidia rufa TaxID=165716 RepID=A0A7J0GPR5_9ERIC|nr:hypothetical protein Acr_23g0011230 [Actinidia rufa]
MPPRKGRGRRGAAAEPEDRVDRIERILEGLVQVVHDVHNNNNHDEEPQQPAMPMPGAGAMPQEALGECRMGSRACYGCDQEGHQIRDLPVKSKIQGAGTSASASIQQPPAERRNNQPRQG